MAKVTAPEKSCSNSKAQLFIFFWLGVLTGALIVAMALMFSGRIDTGKTSLLSPYTSTYSKYMYIPTPPGQFTTIPTPTGQ